MYMIISGSYHTINKINLHTIDQTSNSLYVYMIISSSYHTINKITLHTIDQTSNSLYMYMSGSCQTINNIPLHTIHQTSNSLHVCIWWWVAAVKQDPPIHNKPNASHSRDIYPYNLNIEVITILYDRMIYVSVVRNETTFICESVSTEVKQLLFGKSKVQRTSDTNHEDELWLLQSDRNVRCHLLRVHIYYLCSTSHSNDDPFTSLVSVAKCQQ